MKANAVRFSLFVLFTLFVAAVQAQPGSGGMGGGMPPAGMSLPTPPSPEETASRETKWMKKKLKLTNDQLPPVDVLNLTFATRRSEVMQTLMRSAQMPTQADMTRMQTAMETMQAEKETQLKPILTDEQWATYQKKKGSLRQDMSMGQPPTGGGMMPGGMPRQ